MTAPTAVTWGALATGASQTLAISVPASVVTGNCLVVVLAHGGTMGAMPGTTPWTQKFQASNNICVAYLRTADHIANGSPSSYTFTTTNVLNTITQGGMVQLSGVIATGDPFDVTTTGATTASTSSPGVSLTTTVNDCYLLMSDLKNASRTINVGPSGMTLQSANPSVQHFWDGSQPTAGATGTKNCTWTSGSNHSTTLLAIKPNAILETTGTATGSGSASGSAGLLLGTTGTGSGSGGATAAGAATSSSTGSVTGSSTVDAQASAIAGTTGSSSGAGSASGSSSSVLGSVGSAIGAGTAIGSAGTTGSTTGSSSGSGAATGSGASSAGTTGSSNGSSTATGVTGVVAQTTGTASGDSDVDGVTGLILSTTGTVTVGEGDTIIKPVFVFDD